MIDRVSSSRVFSLSGFGVFREKYKRIYIFSVTELREYKSCSEEE